jgi:hypothetical protein
MNTKKKIWQPSEADIAFIKKRYATFNSKQTITKTRILEKYGISGPVFDRFCVKHGIRPKQPKAPQIKDFSAYQRVPVPDPQYGCVTYILVHPDKCPIQAKKKYVEKLNRNKRKPWETPKSVERAKKIKS